MGFGDLHGRARVDARRPEAFAVCDQCGFWYNAIDLVWLQEWTGNRLINLGFRVCKETCLDVPQEQFRTPILPGDPRPILNPRVEFFEQARGNFGFTLCTLQPPLLATDGGATAVKTAVLNAIAAVIGVTVPSPLQDFSGVITPLVGQAQFLATALTGRQFILIYNPSNAPFVVSTGRAAFAGDPLAVLLGPGNGLVWTAAQQKGPVYPGAMTICGLLLGQQWFGWQA